MPSLPALSAADLELLRRYDTPTICNVIELFDVRPRTSGYMDERIRACYPKLAPMVGYASTATFRSAAPSRDSTAYARLNEQVASFAELPGPPVVVFQDLDNPVVSATFGEVMATSYKAFGAVGLITSGGGRDLEQVASLDFPCFTSGAICAHGYCHLPSLNVPVHVGGLMISPGDLLHGDLNGITTIPHDIASEVAQVCPEYYAAEGVVLDYLRSGKVDPKGFAAARQECKHLLDKLAQRLRRK